MSSGPTGSRAESWENDVFSIIQQQLDYLLQRQNSADQKIYQLRNDQAANVSNVTNIVMSNASPTAEPTRRTSMPAPTFDPLVVESLRNEMDNIKLLVRNGNEQADKKITT